jgi:hypothetical protein
MFLAVLFLIFDIIPRQNYDFKSKHYFIQKVLLYLVINLNNNIDRLLLIYHRKYPVITLSVWNYFPDSWLTGYPMVISVFSGWLAISICYTGMACLEVVDPTMNRKCWAKFFHCQKRETPISKWTQKLDGSDTMTTFLIVSWSYTCNSPAKKNSDRLGLKDCRKWSFRLLLICLPENEK